MEGRAVTGVEAELNQEMNLPGNQFPLEILTPREARQTTDTDGQTVQRSWLDIIRSETAAGQVGITFESVPAGIQSYPVTTTGADASGSQVGRSEAASETAFVVGTAEIKPTRNSVAAVLTIEDQARLPGLNDAITRDLNGAMMEGIDRICFLGDTASTEATTASIKGLATASDITEKTLTQADKIKYQKWLSLYVSLLDGKTARNFADLSVIKSVAAQTLIYEQIANTTDGAANDTVAKTLMDNGISWMVRGDLEDAATTAGKWAAFAGRRRGLAGSGVSAIWNAGTLIRDIYTGAKKGEVTLTLHYLHGLAFPRPSNFVRVKFVA